MNLHGHDIAVCSWSLQPTGMADLLDKVKQLGLTHVQLALRDVIYLDDKRRHQQLGLLRDAGIQFTGGMLSFTGEDYSSIEIIRRTGGYVPDAQWPIREKISREEAKFAKEMGMTQLTTHIGFVPPASDPNHRVMVDRIRQVAAILGEQGQSLLMETGQETAAELLEFLHELNVANVHINFDPANMIMYGAGDPMEAIKLLGKHIRHVHVKDAFASSKPGVEWGREVPFGTGEVSPTAFLKALKSIGYTGPLAIEREAGGIRLPDVLAAIEAIGSAKV